MPAGGQSNLYSARIFLSKQSIMIWLARESPILKKEMKYVGK
ncbi:Uncharacterised protein [Serratia entomophila]|nr:Uncharacterised protein [Serratia entomophila]CAI1029285.1 Uncharacterised protein [Serratia entomophila]CAI1772211.1 Uncharacterised protein [Serratia entomophila]CAI2114502.1 Uncharacterised protein [Serratia entomophila]CAI2926257.1 Uncharacterised protein [Serratia entomophila]